MRMDKKSAPGIEATRKAKQIISSVMKEVPAALILQATAAPQDWMLL